MGRSISNKGLVEDEGQRVATYRRRRANLVKKAKELETLCDIQLCIVMSGPELSSGGPNAPVTIFPEEPEKARLVIQNFKNATMNKSHRSLALADVLNGCKRQPKTAAKHAGIAGSWLDRVGKLSLPELEALRESVERKLSHVKAIQEERMASMSNFMFPSIYDPYVMDLGTDFCLCPPRPHDHPDSNSIMSYQTPPCPLDCPDSNSTMMMMSGDDSGTQLARQSQIDGILMKNEVEYNDYSPYDVLYNDSSNICDLSLGLVNNDNHWVYNDPSPTMWYLSNQSEANFGGFRD